MNVAFVVPPDVAEGCTVSWAVVPTDGPPPAPVSTSNNLYQNVASVDFEALIQRDACHQHPILTASVIRTTGAVVAKNFGTQRESTLKVVDEVGGTELTEAEKEARKAALEAQAARSQAMKSTLLSAMGIGHAHPVPIEKAEDSRQVPTRRQLRVAQSEMDDLLSAMSFAEQVVVLGTTLHQDPDGGKVSASDPKALLGDDSGVVKKGTFVVGDVKPFADRPELMEYLPKRHGADRVHLEYPSGSPRVVHGFTFGWLGGESDSLVFHGLESQDDLLRRVNGVALAVSETPLGSLTGEGAYLHVRLLLAEAAPLTFIDAVPDVALEDRGDGGLLSADTFKKLRNLPLGEFLQLSKDEAEAMMRVIPPFAIEAAPKPRIARLGTEGTLELEALSRPAWDVVVLGQTYLVGDEFSQRAVAAPQEVYMKTPLAFSLGDPRIFGGAVSLSPVPPPDPNGAHTVFLPLKRPAEDGGDATPRRVDFYGFGHPQVVQGDEADRVFLKEFSNLRDLTATLGEVEVRFGLNESPLSRAIPGARAFSVRMTVGEVELTFHDLVVETADGVMMTKAGEATRAATKESGEPLREGSTALASDAVSFKMLEAMMAEVGASWAKGGFGEPHFISFGDTSALAAFVEGVFGFGGCGGEGCPFLSVCETSTKACACDRGLVEYEGQCLDPAAVPGAARETYTNGRCEITGRFSDVAWSLPLPFATAAVPGGTVRIDAETDGAATLWIEPHGGGELAFGRIDLGDFAAEGGEVLAHPRDAAVYAVFGGELEAVPASIGVAAADGSSMAQVELNVGGPHVVAVGIRATSVSTGKPLAWSALYAAIASEDLADIAFDGFAADLADTLDGVSWTLNGWRDEGQVHSTAGPGGGVCRVVSCNGPCRQGDQVWAPPEGKKATSAAVVCADFEGSAGGVRSALIEAVTPDGAMDQVRLQTVFVGEGPDGIAWAGMVSGAPDSLVVGGTTVALEAGMSEAVLVAELGESTQVAALAVSPDAKSGAEGYIWGSSAVITGGALFVAGSAQGVLGGRTYESEQPFVARFDLGAGPNLAWTRVADMADAAQWAYFTHLLDLGDGRIALAGEQSGAVSLDNVTVGSHLVTSGDESLWHYGSEAFTFIVDATSGTAKAGASAGGSVYLMAADGLGGLYVAFDATRGRFGDKVLGGAYDPYMMGTSTLGLGRLDGGSAAWMLELPSDGRKGEGGGFAGMVAVPEGLRVDYAHQAPELADPATIYYPEGTKVPVPTDPDSGGSAFIPAEPVYAMPKATASSTYKAAAEPVASSIPTFGTGIELPERRVFTGFVKIAIDGPCGCSDDAQSAALCGTSSWDPDTGEWTCERGFGAIEGAASVCADIDECAGEISPCAGDNAACVNTIGSYRCECDFGYVESAGGCVDIDECASAETHACSASATCRNTGGGYACDCPGGDCQCPEGTLALDSSGAKCDAVKEVAVGYGHTCGLTFTGRVLCWGLNDKTSGAVGAPLGLDEKSSGGARLPAKGVPSSPYAWVATPFEVELPGPAVAIRAGTNESCAAVGTGRRWYCWGRKEVWVRGYDHRKSLDATDPAAPEAIVGLDGAVDVDAADGDACVVRDDGSVDCGTAAGFGALPTSGCTDVKVNGNGGVFARCDGAWVAMGNNGQGQLGVGGSAMEGPLWVDPPRPVEGAWEHLAASRDMTCGIGHDGVRDHGLYCWGYSPSDGVSHWSPGEGTRYPAATGATWVHLALQGSGFCAVDSAGGAFCGGDGKALGGSAGSTLQPIPVPAGMPMAERVHLVSGVVLIEAGGAVWAYSPRADRYAAAIGGQGGPPAGMVLANGDRAWRTFRGGPGSFSCGIAADDRLLCGGGNWNGQLGQGHMDPVEGLVEVFLPEEASGDGWAEVALGSDHACGTSRAGELVCWGQNWNGQLGTGDWTAYLRPTLVFGAGSEATARGVVAGAGHTCAVIDLDGDGGEVAPRVHCWGANWSGQLGLRDYVARTVPTAVQPLEGRPDFASVRTGPYHTCFVDAAGDAFSAGSNGNGELGVGTSSFVDPATGWSRSDTPTPQPVVGLTARVVDVAMTSGRTCFVQEGGLYACSGSNWGQELGNAWSGTAYAPVTIALPFDVSQLVLSSNMSCALSTGRDFACVGRMPDNTIASTFQTLKGGASGGWQSIGAEDNGVVGISDGALFTLGSVSGLEEAGGFAGPVHLPCHLDADGEGRCLPPATQVCDSSLRLCRDRDECSDGTATCASGRACGDVQAGFACFCPNGEDDGEGGCVAADWTASGVCEGALSTVVDPTRNDYRCDCGDGEVVWRVGPGLCDDANECAETFDLCGELGVCENTPADTETPSGYQCSCPEGTALGAEGTCEDIDECAQGTHACGTGATCLNGVGDYLCECPEGSTCSCPEGTKDIDGDGSRCE